jgi:YidC/Oxa1 family membrane protein insertase
MRNNLQNVFAFVLLAAGLTAGWWYIDKSFFPKPPPPEPKPEERLSAIHRELAAALVGTAPAAAPPLTFTRSYITPPKPPEPKELPKPAATPPTQSEPHALISLGDDSFFLKVLLTNTGGGVQQVLLRKFEDASRLGLPVKAPDGTPRPLTIIPGYLRPLGKFLKDEPQHYDLVPNFDEGAFRGQRKPGPVAFETKLSAPSYALLHYPSKDDPARPRDEHGKPRPEDDNFPLATLGERNWKVVDVQQPKGESGMPWVVAFEAELGDPYFVRIRKTYTLHPKEYDFRLKVEVRGLPGRRAESGVLRYQLTGPVGMPIEGEWYTSTSRNVYVGWLDGSGNPQRTLDDAASIQYMAGGPQIRKPADGRFRYAAVGTQYFASALALDSEEKDAWDYVRPVREDLPTDPPEKLGQPWELERRFLYDVSFRAVSPLLDLKVGQALTNEFAVYNGPIKVRLLSQLAGEDAIQPDVVKRYLETYHLETMTDYHSPTWIGRFANFIWWSDIVIASTNIMHSVLAWLHSMVGSWGVSIMLLTVLVRLCLFVPSRHQQKITADMQAKIAVLKPDLDRIQEKYKDDFLRQQQAKSELFRENGISHTGQMRGCLLLFAQMPIMMGLYFCLQESVFFRLQEFLWMPNLAAPDMLAWWSEHIPLISSPGNRFGDFSFLYLGPFFNVLPMFAVVLFWVQQKLTMPPPTNDMEEQQRKMMKYMLIVTGLFFYKVAGGLCLYFIVSGLWTLAERRLIPKPKTKPVSGLAPGTGGTGTGGGSGPEADGGGGKPPGLMGRFRQRLQERLEEMQRQAEGQRQIVNRPGESQQQPARPTAGERAERRKKKKRK